MGYEIVVDIELKSVFLSHDFDWEPSIEFDCREIFGEEEPTVYFSLGCPCFGVTLGIWWDSRDTYALREQKNLHYLLSDQIKTPRAASNIKC